MIEMVKRPALEVYQQAADYIRERLPQIPHIAVVLGSGLDGICDRLQQTVSIPYSQIPGFPISTVQYQKGELLYGILDGDTVLCMNGRFHTYEGWQMWETSFPVVVFHLLGIDRMILTNAAGGINPSFTPGDLMLVRDHIKFALPSPLQGRNDPALGDRFFDMQRVYDKNWIANAHSQAEMLGFSLREGVYAFMTGPQYETPAEIHALSVLGADAVGMSTVAEVIEAAHCGIRVLCISSITNMAAGITGAPLTEDEVLQAAHKNEKKFCALVSAMIREMLREKDVRADI